MNFEVIIIGSGFSGLTCAHYLKEQGVILMRQDGLIKAQAGLTSVEEVGRVVQLEVGETLDDA